MGDRITKAMPPAVMGKDVPLNKIFDETHPRYGDGSEFRTLCATDPEVGKVVETAKGLEGLKRQWGVHACAVIMSSEPLVDHIPIMRREQDGAIITQFDYPTCESLGLLKMDFLGLRNLTVIDDAVRNVRANRDLPLVIEDLPLTDPNTYALLARGDTLGVFQLDGGPMRALLRLMAPTEFEDIAAVLALYRARADGGQRAQRLRRPQERPQAGHPDPSRPGRAAGRNPRRDARPGRLPGAGPGHRPQGRRLHARGRPTCCAGRWARRRRPN